MKHSSIPSAQTVVLHCKAKGIQNIVISPGSRNAPLIIGFTGDPYFKCFSIVDERSAAFFALGIAQQTKTPVAVVCTSGSALLNYYPAVAEAFYSDIPLLVISANRPSYKIDIGDGQTIRQMNVFENHIGYSANLMQDVVHSTDKVQKYGPGLIVNNTMEDSQQKVQSFNDAELNNAINRTISKKVPVHINVPFEEPLYDQMDDLTVAPSIDEINYVGSRPVQEIISFANIWNNSSRKMVLIGVNDPDAIAPAIVKYLADDPSVVVLTETTSNLHDPSFFPSIDSILAPIEKLTKRAEIFGQLRPEILLTFGGLIVSKKIKSFLRDFKPQHHWHIDPKQALNTFFCLSHHFKADVNSFFKEFLVAIQSKPSKYHEVWNLFKSNYIAKRTTFMKEVVFSNLWTYHRIFDKIPHHFQLQLANSSTVRYAQLFDLHKTLRIFCNRGTSGIDGSTSTAIGASIFYENPTLFITGDLSFFYDSNGLWSNYIRSDFRIVVINNQGGGIFRILPGHADNENFENYFETSHTLTAKKLCEMHGIEYSFAQDKETFEKTYCSFFNESGNAKLLEIYTPRVVNNKILMGYFDFISSGIINH